MHHAKCWAGWNTSWNQDCREKYQQPQICRWYHLNGRKSRGTKESPDEGERGEWKSWLKTQLIKIMGASPIISWHIYGEKMKTVTEFTFFGYKTTADSDCSHKIKRYLLLERKAMTNLVVVQSLDRVQFFAAPWTTAHQASLSFTRDSPGACSNSRPLSQWCYPTILSSVVPFSSCPQSFPASGSFPASQLFTSGGQSIRESQLQHQSF